MILCYAVLLLTVPLAAGLFAGQREKVVRDFLLCFAAVLALSAGYMAFISQVNSGISGVLLKIFASDYYELSKFIRKKPSISLPVIIWGSLSIFSVLYMFSFCVRRYCRRWWTGIIALILAVMVINSSFMIFYHSISWLAIWRADNYFQYPTTPNGVMTIILLNCLLIFWTVWVLVRKELNWKKLAEAVTVYLGFAVVLWATALAGTYFSMRPLVKKAELAGIEPMKTEWQKMPPEMQTMYDDLQKFRKEHPDFVLPPEATEPWEKMKESERNYTLKHFETQEILAYYALYEKLLFYPRDRKVLCNDMFQRPREYARIQTGRAQLYHLTGKPEKGLPLLLRLVEFDRHTANSPWNIDELLRNACRALWISAMIQFGPDGKEYAPVYREVLEYLKKSKPHLPSEAGVWLAEYHINSFGKFLALPSLYAMTVKALNFALSPELKRLEEQEVFVNPSTYWENNAMKSRDLISTGSIGMALKCYRTEHGAYPAKLDMLVPDYLPRIPAAPKNGTPFKYRTDGKAFILESPVRTLKSSTEPPASLKQSSPNNGIFSLSDF